MQRITSLVRTLSSLGKNLYVLPTSLSGFQDFSRELLTPQVPNINLICGIKIKGRVRRRCKSCYFVFRDQRVYIMCPAHPRHKQMSMKPKPHNTWILTHASQSRVRPW